MALKYQQHLDTWGVVSSAVIISPPDTREGHEDIDDTAPPEVETFWKRMMDRYGSEDAYNREIIADFAREDGVELLIVVDKLLVGFDEPRNTVLYIDKPLRDHAILQAIARVNRLFEGKDFGYVIDYCGILGELNAAVQVYDALAEFDTPTTWPGRSPTSPPKSTGCRSCIRTCGPCSMRWITRTTVRPWSAFLSRKIVASSSTTGSKRIRAA
jgi:hypothetical protein